MRPKKNRVILSFGGNIDDPKSKILLAYELVEAKIGPICSKSSFYSSKSWGFESINDFINSIIIIETDLSPIELLKATQGVEIELGRQPKKEKGYESRPIDIDIIDYSTMVIEGANIQIPHKLMHQRNFVLIPLLEILPNWIHPVFNKKLTQLIAEIKEDNSVEKLL